MKDFLLFVLLFLCLTFSLVAQVAEYTITEAELLRLEKISENLERHKRNQQLQVRSLKTRLTEALTKLENLNNQLQTERETLKSLRQSYAEYERGVGIKMQEYKESIDKLKVKLHKARLTIVIMSCLFVFLLLSNIIFFILKTKLKL